MKTYYTSAADAVLTAHRLPEFGPSATHSLKSRATIHGQNSETSQLSSSHKENAANASEAGQLKVDLSPTSSPLPARQTLASSTSSPPTEPLSFSKRPVPTNDVKANPSASTAASVKPSLLSAALSSAPPQSSSTAPTPVDSGIVTLEIPHKAIDTKHAGQQSLCVRSDGRIIATGGWDSRIRIYSAKTLKELAVLKWHKEGVYAVAFGAILDGSSVSTSLIEQGEQRSGRGTVKTEVATTATGLSRLQRQREEKIQSKHWIAAGAKDGKVSLWEIY
jgi:WD40 repeat protein